METFKLIDHVWVTHVIDHPAMQLWDFYSDKMPSRRAGQLFVARDRIITNLWTVHNVFLHDRLRNQGLMRRFIREHALPSLKVIGSDLSGTTSDSAVSMWKALGAQQYETTLCPKGYVWILKGC